MSHNSLDDLLDGSAPDVRVPPRRDVEAMIADAREQTVTRHTPRTLLVGGAVAALLVTGIGTAAATDGFSWAPWVRNPLGAIPFTMANGFSCELRFSEYTGGTDPAFVGEVNRVLREWYLSGDAIREVEALVPAARQDPALSQIELGPGGTLESLPPEEVEHREWVREWTAWDQAIGEAEWNELNSRGIHAGDPRMASAERNGQIQCLGAC